MLEAPKTPFFQRPPRGVGFANRFTGNKNFLLSTPSLAASSDSVPSVIRPHLDAHLHFDFEPALEKKDEQDKSKQVRTTDPRFRTVVCMHWIKSLCQKGDRCDFLHQVDSGILPDCKSGERCQDKMCMLKHTKDEDRQLCNNYNLGFCEHGGGCRYLHRKRPQSELPVVCDFVQITTAPNVPSAPRPPSQVSVQANIQRRPNWRTALCQTYSTTGTCTYGETCDFAHSIEEMNMYRAKAGPFPFPRPQFVPPGDNVIMMPPPPAANKIPRRQIASDLDKIILRLRDWQNVSIDPIYLKPLSLPLASGSSALLPDEQSARESFRYFLCRSQDFNPLMGSLGLNQWMSLNTAKMNEAFKTSKQVFLFFAVDDNECFAGVAKMTSPFVNQLCSLEWLRLCELSFKKTSYLTSVDPRVQRELPVSMGIEGQEFPPNVGKSLMKMIYAEEELTVDPMDYPLVAHPLGPSAAVAQAYSTSPLIAPLDTVEVKQPGFVLSIPTRELLTECLQLQMCGVQEEFDVPIEIGSLFFLYSEGKLYGVFEAISQLESSLWEPKLTQAFRYVVKFRVVMPCEPMHENAVPLFRERKFIGAYTREMLQPLVNLFAAKTKRGEICAPLKSPAIEAYERNLPLPMDVAKGFTAGEVIQLEPSLFKQSCLLNYDFMPEFRAPHKLIGVKGQNMKLIQIKSNCVRARVLGNEEDAPCEGVIELLFEATTRESLDLAFKLGKELVEDVLKQYDEFVKKTAEVTKQFAGFIRPSPRGYVPRGYAPRGPPMSSSNMTAVTPVPAPVPAPAVLPAPVVPVVAAAPPPPQPQPVAAVASNSTTTTTSMASSNSSSRGGPEKRRPRSPPPPAAADRRGRKRSPPARHRDSRRRDRSRDDRGSRKRR